jgi:hypothetical protein
MYKLLQQRDFYAGCFVIMIGLGVVIMSSSYTIGTLTQVGSGLFPAALGVVMIVIGILIAALASDADEEILGDLHSGMPDIRGGLCILLGVVSFIVIGQYGGLAPATFASVFISSLGDRTSTLRGSFILSAIMTIVGTLLFSYLLQSSLPMFQWGA